MSSSQKRQLSSPELEIITAESIQEPPKKKQKLRRYPNKRDNQRFYKILHAVRKSRLIQKYRIAPSIIDDIAAYATGFTANCLNPRCDDKLVWLHEDADKGWMTDECQTYYQTAGYEWGYSSEKYDAYNKNWVAPNLLTGKFVVRGWCIKCYMPTVPCNKCGHRYLKMEHMKVECAQCEPPADKRLGYKKGDVQKFHYCENPKCRLYGKTVQCHQCKRAVCKEHCLKCDAAQHPLCEGCFDQNKSITAWKCGRCDRTVGKHHENCDNQMALQYEMWTTACSDAGRIFGTCEVDGCVQTVCWSHRVECTAFDGHGKHLFCGVHQEMKCPLVIDKQEESALPEKEMSPSTSLPDDVAGPHPQTLLRKGRGCFQYGLRRGGLSGNQYYHKVQLPRENERRAKRIFRRRCRKPLDIRIGMVLAPLASGGSNRVPSLVSTFTPDELSIMDKGYDTYMC